METQIFDAPTLYADHHVSEVRRLLLDLPGVQEVYASSAFYTIEVTYDPEKISAPEIRKTLEEAGYLGEWILPHESGEAVTSRDKGNAYFRHTTVHEQTRVIGFAQQTAYQGRPLWPCPGLGVIEKIPKD